MMSYDLYVVILKFLSHVPMFGARILAFLVWWSKRGSFVWIHSCVCWDPLGTRPMDSWNFLELQKRKNMAKIAKNAPAGNRTRGPTMATLDFATKPLVPWFLHKTYSTITNYIQNTHYQHTPYIQIYHLLSLLYTHFTIIVYIIHNL